MTPVQREVERAKAADTTAKNRALTALKKTAAYQAADANVQSSLETTEIAKLMHKR
jgi:hypothetical protein